MSSYVEAASSFSVGGLLMSWLRCINLPDSISNFVLSPFTVILMVIILAIFIGFHPAVNAVSRAPLRKHLGLKFREIKLRPYNLSIKLTDIELPCSESSIIRAIILAVFPSSHVKHVEGYPESRIKIKYLSVKVRISPMAAAFNSTADVELGASARWMYKLIPKPYIRIKLHGLDVWVEKAYLAPNPPEFCTSSPPSAIQDLDTSHLPTFEQDSLLNWLINDETSDADRVTFCIERWIDHVTTKIKTNSKSTKSNSGSTLNHRIDSHETSKAKTSTYDEKFNAYARSITLALLQSLSLEVINATIVISGVSSDYARATRKKCGPRRANFKFATQKRRALTIGSADLLTLCFSPDSKCVGVLCGVGLSLKVGHPPNVQIEGGAHSENSSSVLEPSNSELPFEWHTIIHPFELVAELSGIIPIVIWAINYDHYWDTRSIGLTLSSSKVAVSLSPSHIHTALLHLDDYTDANSPSNEWIQWLTTNFHRTLKTDEREKLAYCQCYAQANGKKREDTNKKVEQSLSTNQMKDLERRMSRNEIISLRCIAMADHWRIPKSPDRTSDELANFLENSRSTIAKSEDIKMTDLDEPHYSFQVTYPSALRALVSLIREKNSFLAPSLPVMYHFRKFLIDFPIDLGEIRTSIEHPIPSCIDLHEVAFSTELESLIFGRGKSSSPVAPRPWLSLGLHIREIEWSVLISDPNIPALLDQTPVGIVYKHRQLADRSNALTLDINISMEPTKQLDPHYSLSCCSSFMSLVINPLPLLSAIQTLILVTDIPMQTLEAKKQDHETKDQNPYLDKGNRSDERDADNVALPNVIAEFSIECCSLIFLVDRLKLRRGILDFNVNSLTISLNVTAISASLVVAADPMELCAGQHHYYDARVVWSLLPLKPIIVLEGTRILLATTEKDPKQKSNASNQSSIMKTIRVCLEVCVDVFCLNASPSTIVALLEAFSSVKPFATWWIEDIVEEEKQSSLERQKATEERQRHLEQRRKALLEVFELIDVDGSGSLQDTELAEVIRLMFEKTTSGVINPQQKLTSLELETQHSYLLSILDPSSTNDISYQELDDLLFRIANSIDDINLIPKMMNSEEFNTSRTFNNADYFLSTPYLRNLVHFDDLREHASWHQVYRIVGHDNIDERLPFPAPNFWLEGGIQLFWDLYENETGCTSDDLKGLDVAMVQQKLVRALCNYKFAKFCWKSLVQPQLQGKSGVAGVTSWIDSNTKSRNVGVIDKILETISSNAQESTPQKQGMDIFLDVSFVAKFNRVSLNFGSSHMFTQPLVDINLRSVESNATGLLSKYGRLVPISEESNECNKIVFHGMISAMHLNTRHDYMECLMEPFPCFAHATYKVFLTEDGTDHDNEPERTSISVYINCPRFLNINTSPSFFESATLLNKVISESDPKTYRKWIVKRDLAFVKVFWSEFTTSESDALSRHDAKEALRLTLELHWRDDIKGFSDEGKDHLITRIVDLAETNESGMIPFHNMEQVLKKILSRCYFSGSKELQVVNNCGRALKVSTRSNKWYNGKSDRVETEHEMFKSIEDGHSGSLVLEESDERFKSSGGQRVNGTMSFLISGYRKVTNVTISPYQSFMIPLKLPKDSKRRRARRNKPRNASGFAPHLTVVPEEGCLTSISLVVRTSVAIQTEHPVNIRIVRLPKSFGRSRQGAKTKLDLSKKKYLSAALQAFVEGAQIVFEMRQVEREVTVPVHLGVLDSSCHHALLIQDLSEHNDSWRHPILITKDFLFNPRKLVDVTRCHAMSGIIVHRERICIQREQPVFTDSERNYQETTWDAIIKIIPFFLLQNSMPYMISVRLWQLAQDEDDDLWQHPTLCLRSTGTFDEDSGSDDDNSAMTPTSQTSRCSNHFHQSSGREKSDFLFVGSVESCQMLRLSGISLSQPIFMQVSQCVESHDLTEKMNFMWSKPLCLSLDKLRTGANRKGTLSLPQRVLDLGDDVDALVDVSVDSEIRMPACTIFCPFWITNKTGMKMEYKVSGQSKKYLDSGAGGLPIMIHGAKSIETNATYKKVSRQISAIPIECPKESLLKHWWDETTNGKLVLKNIPMNNNVEWSENIELDAVGTSGELLCRNVVLNTAIESLAGAFHRSSLVTLSPRYVIKNLLHIAITVIPLCGSQNDVIRKALHLRRNPTSSDEREQLILNPNESTVLYSFHDISFEGTERSRRWVVFCVNATRSRGTHLKPKWHIFPTDEHDQFYFGEHDGLDTMSGIVQAKVHKSSFGSILMGISHSAIPPYRIENRTASHYIQFVQDDDDAIVFELPPMHSCGFTWDSPLGKKELMATVVPRTESKNSIGKQGLLTGQKVKEDDTVSLTKSEVTEETPASDHAQGKRNDEQQRTSKFRRFFIGGYKRYRMSKPGRQKDLPVKSAKEWRLGSTPSLSVHMRIMGGTKILSFSDSDWLAQQVERGNLRKGGEFKHAESVMNLEGIGLYIIDNLNRELLGITVRDVQFQKPGGSIDFTLRVRHFQADAMLPSARYPIIIQPLPLGVDRREPFNPECEGVLGSNIVKRDCYWENYNEKPIPVLELNGSYIPQTNMTWIPSLDLMICPCKIEIDVDYILRVVGVIMNSMSKFQDDSEHIVATSSASERLQYVSRGQQDICLTYIEKLYIAPLILEIELIIKPDDSDDNDGYESLTLNAIAQSTNSSSVAGILSWIVNVGANFAHVSPCFRYNEIADTDRYCNVVDLATDIAISYVVKTIKQCYKLVFSMHLLGDPSLYAYQVKTGVTDLFTKTRDEISARGKDGVGQGVASFFSNVVGGFFVWGGKLTGGIAETLDSIAMSEYTSNHLKAKSDGKPAQNAIEGVVQGTEFLSRTVVHGVAGLVGNPYRGMKSGGAAGFTKGAASGVTGLIFAPFIGALGFVAKTSEGIGENSKMLNIAVIEARCRPSRSMPWGKPMVDTGLSFLKGIGIRVHTVRYQKVRKQLIQQAQDIEISSKELKRARAAEERRKNPPSKAISIIHNKQRQHYLTYKVKPKLLSDSPGNWVLSHYAVTFEETLILRTPDLQLTDQVMVNFWNYKGLKFATTKSRPLASCTLNVSDIYSSMVAFYKERQSRKEKGLSDEINSDRPREGDKSLPFIVPTPQEFALFRLCKPTFLQDDVVSAVCDEITSIQKKEEDAFGMYDSDSLDSDSDNLSVDEKKKAKKDESENDVHSNERLYGTISLSFFPIPW